MGAESCSTFNLFSFYFIFLKKACRFHSTCMQLLAVLEIATAVVVFFLPRGVGIHL